MKDKDYRLKLSFEDFDRIPIDKEYPIDGYYAELIDKNVNFSDEEFSGSYENINLIKQLTKGQQLLILLGIFDGQVSNGGITQFFWNYPDYIFEVRDAIEYLGNLELLTKYEKALETLSIPNPVLIGYLFLSPRRRTSFV